jgi:hypothetical protein
MPLSISWLSLFADVPAARLARDLEFWAAISGWPPGEPHGDQREFVPLLPADGDAVLWLQRVDGGSGGWHPDFHVPDADEAAAVAVAAGAREQQRYDGLVVLNTPGGQPFCVVTESRANRRRPSPPTRPAGSRSLADQLCLDIPADAYEDECAFWAELTGWAYALTDAPEFRRLNPPQTVGVQLLLQRLGADDSGGPRAHLDLSADDRRAEAERHEASGATALLRTDGWTTLRDPAGLLYCVTERPLVTERGVH